MDVVIVLVVAVVVAALATYVFFSSRRARATVRLSSSPKVPSSPKVAVRKFTPTAQATPVTRPLPEAIVPPPPPPAPAPLFDLDLDLEPAIVPAAPVEIRWSKQFDRRSGTLDETARLRLIGDLGVVAKEWCVPLLCQAYEEERRPGHRQAALIALAACRSRAATGTFRLALASDDPAERAIAADGLTDLEPPPQAKARRIVERPR